MICFGHNYDLKLKFEAWLMMAHLTASVRVDLGFEIECLLKCFFLTLFSKIYCLTKEDVPGACKVSIKKMAFFVSFTPVYLNMTSHVSKMAAKLTSSYISRCFHKCTCHLVRAHQN